MKIICIDINYRAHNMETGQALPYEEDDDPVLFMKPDTALLQGDRNRFYIPGFSSDIHYETELVVRIDKMGKNIGERFACRYYSEITLGIDFTVRDIQAGLKQRSRPWEISKAFDHSAAVGAFVSKEKYGKSVQELDFHLKIDDKAVQSANTSGMIHTVDKIVAFASRFFTLKTGDLIFTGTPAGAGRVETGNILRGFLEDDELLDLHIC